MILQCAHRFEELKLTGGFPLVDNQCNTVTDRGSSTLPDGGSTQLEPGGAVDTGGSRGTGQWSWSQLIIHCQCKAVLDAGVWTPCWMPLLHFPVTFSPSSCSNAAVNHNPQWAKTVKHTSQCPDVKLGGSPLHPQAFQSTNQSRQRLIPSLYAANRFQSDAVRTSCCSGEGEKSLSRGQ